VKKMNQQKERNQKAAREGPKPKKKQLIKKTGGGAGGGEIGTLSRARMAIESASAILSDNGPA